MLGYPQGTMLHPTIFVRNVTDAPISPTMLVSWKSTAAAGKAPLDLGKVAAEETRVVDLTALQSVPPNANWANVEITYSGRLGDLIAVAASYDESKRYGLQSPFSSSISYMWKAGMWHVDPTHDTLITTGNGGQKDARVAISLFYGDTGVYEMPEKLLLPGRADLGEFGRSDSPPDRRQERTGDSAGCHRRLVRNQGLGREGRRLFVRRQDDDRQDFRACNLRVRGVLHANRSGL